METVLEISKYLLPAIVVMVTAIIIIRIMLKDDEKRRKMELVLNNQKTTLPMKLQAYERLALLLERLSPESMIMRLNTAQMSAKQLHSELLTTIRAEFDHNIAQQIYVSQEAWEIIRHARVNLIKLINETANEVKADAGGIDFGKRVLEKEAEMEKPPTRAALDFLKSEARQFY